VRSTSDITVYRNAAPKEIVSEHLAGVRVLWPRGKPEVFDCRRNVRAYRVRL